jgi:hypothetical protein
MYRASALPEDHSRIWPFNFSALTATSACPNPLRLHLAVEQLIACSTPLTSRLRRAAEQLARSLAQWQNHFRLGSGIDYSHLA